MYSQNDWRYYSDELMHYGILGQKWGVRRYQNADGSLTNAGRERYGKGGQRKRAAETLRKDFTSLDDYDYTKSTKNVSKEIKAIRGSKNVSKAVDNYLNAMGEFRGYVKNWDSVKKYSNLQGLVDCSDMPFDEKAWTVNSYVYGDLDQDQSFNLYMTDKGKSINEYSKKAKEAYADYKSAVDGTINKYFDMDVNEALESTTWNNKVWNTTVSDVITRAVQNVDERFIEPELFDGYDEKQLKSDLDRAKKELAQYQSEKEVLAKKSDRTPEEETRYKNLKLITGDWWLD